MPKAQRGGNKAASNKGTPKRVPKGKRGGGGGGSDEDSVCETASVMSLNSDRGSYDDGSNGNIDDYEDGSGRDVTVFGETLEDKVSLAIEQLTEKSANVRLTALTSIANVLKQGYNPELILGRRETLRDNLERIFKRGSAAEQAIAANVFALAIIQLGGYDEDLASEDFLIMKPVLNNLMLDHTASIGARAKCCDALCLGLFLAGTSVHDTATIEPLFRVKKMTSEPELADAFGIGASPAKTVKVQAVNNVLACSALAGFTLLLTVLSKEYLSARVNGWIRLLQALLNQPDLDLRLHAGEALAVLLELCEINGGSDGTEGESDEDTEHSKIDVDKLIEKLRELSVESHKYRAKKDKRQQHHSFRDFLKAVESGEGPDIQVKFSSETLEIYEWTKKRQYDAVSDIIGSGINKHLEQNPLLRQIFELGATKPALDNSQSDARQAKSDRQYMNAVNFKVRSVNRGKNRDNRMAELELEDF